MCVAVPMKLISAVDGLGVVEISGVKRNVGLQLVPEAKVGDYLIVHAGYAIQILDEKEAEETLALFKEMEGLG